MTGHIVANRGAHGLLDRSPPQALAQIQALRQLRPAPPREGERAMDFRILAASSLLAVTGLVGSEAPALAQSAEEDVQAAYAA